MAKKWALVSLATAQFVMVLDQSVMNVSISQLVEDFDTTVTMIQAVITLYCLVMAMFMLTGGKIGDIIGRRRAFVIGLVIYACGSAPHRGGTRPLPILALGWSFLEGHRRRARASRDGRPDRGELRREPPARPPTPSSAASPGAGIAVGPILGGWATTELSWRVVFAGEVLLVAFILLMTRFIADAPRDGPKPRLDGVGTVLSAGGLGVVVLGVLQSSTWGWVKPKDSPVEPFGLSLTLFVIAFGGVLLWCVRPVGAASGGDGQGPARPPRPHEDPVAAGRALRAVQPEPHPDGRLLRHPAVPAAGARARRARDRHQDAAGLHHHVPRLGDRARAVRLAFPIRTIVRAGLWTTVGRRARARGDDRPAAARRPASRCRWPCSGVGMGLMASQLGNVVQSSVDASGRG